MEPWLVLSIRLDLACAAAYGVAIGSMLLPWSNDGFSDVQGVETAQGRIVLGLALAGVAAYALAPFRIAFGVVQLALALSAGAVVMHVADRTGGGYDGLGLAFGMSMALVLLGILVLAERSRPRRRTVGGW